MTAAGLGIGVAMLLWWFSTGAILYLVRLGPEHYRRCMLGATVCAGGALLGLAATGGAAGAGDALIAFGFALVLWGWHEMSVLMGVMAGPRRLPCPAGALGWQRFKLAALTVLNHEIAIALTLAVVAAMTWGQPNQIGVATLALLWGMRLSTKFNLFLGVARPHADLLPPHLSYFASYFRDRPMNGLFPLSVTGAAMLTLYLFERGFAPHATAFDAAGYGALGALSGLALLEHWFLVAPLPDEALWAWAKPKRSAELTKRGEAGKCPPQCLSPLRAQSAAGVMPVNGLRTG